MTCGYKKAIVVMFLCIEIKAKSHKDGSIDFVKYMEIFDKMYSKKKRG